jgi:hypothetical protein
MKLIIILVFLLSSVDMWTNIYQQYKDRTFTKTLFLSETFLGNNFDRSVTCREIKNGGKFRTELKKRNINCRGDWCDSYGEFTCPKGNNGCYDAMHIIPGHDILGNYIMVYNRWRAANPSLYEKNDALGNIYDMAQRNVQECMYPGSTSTNGGNNNDYSDSYEEDTTEDFSLIIYILIGICIGIFAIIKLNSKKVEGVNLNIDIENGGDVSENLETMDAKNTQTENVTDETLGECVTSDYSKDKI